MRKSPGSARTPSRPSRAAHLSPPWAPERACP
jgi:hypothetical protein